MVDHIDRPIASNDEDLLDRAEFIRTLAKALINEVPASGDQAKEVHSKGNVIGLTGEWGSGKSSVLNLLAAYLGTRSKTIVVQFNPWMFLSQSDLLNGFFNELTFQLGKSQLDQLKELLGLIDEYRESLSATQSALSAAFPTLGSGWSIALSLVPRGRRPSPQATRKKIEKKIKSMGVAVVVLIDELDRVEDEEVRAVARLIKAIGDIQGISYLVAYDPKRVVDALGRGSGVERSKSGEAYLEKLIQLVVPVRPLLDYEVMNLLKGALAGQGYHNLLSDDEALKELASSLNTPRDIKRVVANFCAIEPMVQGEVNPLDVLLYSYLLIKAPVLRDRIAQAVDMVVDDPTEEYQMLLFDRASRDGNKSPSAVDILGEIAAPHVKVLTSLFPAFAKHGRRDNDSDRISKRRNLLKLLYLGSPPHDISVREVRAFWMSSPDAIAAKLHQVTEDGRLRVFAERVGDLLLLLPEERDVDVWPQIAKSLLRDSDWIAGPEPLRDAAEDLESAIRFLGSKVEGGTERAKNIFTLLVQAGDLVITPSLMRSHVHKYGLANWSRGREKPDFRVIYSQAEFELLIPKEAARYRAAIETGFFLKRAPDPDAIFFLSNLDLFDEVLKQSLTDQLSDVQAIGTFAALVVPPGFMTGRDTFERLIDCEAVERRIAAALSENAFSDCSDWIQNSVSRFYRILTGADPYD